MNRKIITWFFKNLGVLLFVALPCFFVFVWIQAILNKSPGRFELGYVIETGAFYYIAYILPIAISGLIHSLIIALFPTTWSCSTRRAIVFIFTPIIPFFFILFFRWRIEIISEFLVPIILMLGVYGFLFKLQERNQSRQPAT